MWVVLDERAPPAPFLPLYCQFSPATRRWYALEGRSLTSVSAPVEEVQAGAEDT